MEMWTQCSSIYNNLRLRWRGVNGVQISFFWESIELRRPLQQRLCWRTLRVVFETNFNCHCRLMKSKEKKSWYWSQRNAGCLNAMTHKWWHVAASLMNECIRSCEIYILLIMNMISDWWNVRRKCWLFFTEGIGIIEMSKLISTIEWAQTKTENGPPQMHWRLFIQ